MPPPFEVVASDVGSGEVHQDLVRLQAVLSPPLIAPDVGPVEALGVFGIVAGLAEVFLGDVHAGDRRRNVAHVLLSSGKDLDR